MAVFKLGLAQINPTLGNFACNEQKIVAMLEQAKSKGIDFVVFPEMVLCGYPPEDLLHHSRFLQANQTTLERIIPETLQMTAIIGLAQQAGGQVYNAAAVLHQGKLAAVYHKIELPNYGVFDEKRYFWPGTRPLILEYTGLRIALTICEDVWVEQGPVEQFILQNQIDVVLNLSASPFHAGKAEVRREVLSGLARRTHTFVCYANLVGGQDELVFDGGSMVLAPDGKVLAQTVHFQEKLMIAELPMTEPTSRKNTVLAPDVHCVTFSTPASIPFSNEKITVPSEVEQVYSALILGTQDYVRKNNFTQVVLGISGGIDSALTAAIAVAALGNENVNGVTMPSEFTSAETLADSVRLAENLKLSLHTIPIRPMLSAFETSLHEVLGTDKPGLEHENLQARIRGNILMALSNRFGWLVLTTGNKSEIAVGYCTLYGDMAGGFAMLKDVPKTLVYQLSAFINQKAGRDLIPLSTIERAPSAELRPNQKDQDSLPPYVILDEIIKAYVEEDQDPIAIIKAGFDPETVAKSIRLIDKSEYKRRQAPPGVKITPKAFGRDRRMPLTNHFTQELLEP